MQEKFVKSEEDGEFYNRLTKEELELLSTQRLYNILRKNRDRHNMHGEYYKDIKEVLSKRPHLKRKKKRKG